MLLVLYWLCAEYITFKYITNFKDKVATQLHTFRKHKFIRKIIIMILPSGLYTNKFCQY